MKQKVLLASLLFASYMVQAQHETDWEIKGNLTIGKTGESGSLRIKRGSDGNVNGALGFLGGGEERHNLALQSTSGGGYITFRTNNGGIDERMRIANNGNVGIGSSSPAFKLDVNGNLAIGKKNDAGNINFRRGTDGWVGAANIGFSDIGEAHNFRFKVSTGSGYFTFYTNNNGDLSEKMRITHAGKVGIGIESPTHKLEVNGTIRSKEVKVEASPWPDYVFADDYELSTLEETASYIEENHHLPEIPSAKEMEAHGVNLGEMNMLLLKKIEELTLHLIEIKGVVSEQQKEIEALKSK